MTAARPAPANAARSRVDTGLHLRRDVASDHTLCGYPITARTRTLTIAEATSSSSSGQVFPICRGCVGRFQRLRA